MKNSRIRFEHIRKEIERLINLFSESGENIGLFKALTGNEWLSRASKREIPKTLFGKFWYENELCILFADTNLGKSILAVQIGDSISKGIEIPKIGLGAKKQKILYFDFELSDKQFENRYSINYELHYSFDDNFIRIEINPDAEIPEKGDFEGFLIDSLEKAIIETNAKVLIIDNITYLGTETEKAKDALPLMKKLKALKSKYSLSLLVLAHTPKRDLSKPITRNDLQGSKMLINFCDSSFAIGEDSNDNRLRYLKQIKARNTEIIYHTENVIICEIEKKHNFVEFVILGYSQERRHLKTLTDKDKEKRFERIKELHMQGWTQRKIAKELHISPAAVNKYIKKIKEE
jgi:hypothetical protein